MDFSPVLHIYLSPTYSFAIGVFCHALCLGKKLSVFMKICPIHTFRHYLHFHKEVHYNDNLYSSLCSKCTQINPTHHESNIFKSIHMTEMRSVHIFCKWTQIIVLIIKYQYIYNKLILWRNASASLLF